MERSHDWDDLTPMINKCFRRKIKFPPNLDMYGYEYCTIIGLPPVETTRNGSSHMNKYQLPAMFFRVAPVFLPFDTSDHDDYGDVFQYGTVFTGDLPEKYRNGALNNGLEEPYEECSRFDYINAAESRFREFIRKIFEPTTPPM